MKEREPNRREIVKKFLVGAAALGLSNTAEAQARSTDYSGLLLASAGTLESRTKLATQVIDKIRTSIENGTDRSAEHGYLHQADYKFSDDLSIGVAFEVAERRITALRFIFAKELGGAIGELEMEAVPGAIGDVLEVRKGAVPGQGRPAFVRFGDSQIDLNSQENREFLNRFYNGMLTFLVAQG